MKILRSVHAKWKRILTSFLIAAVLTAFAASGLLSDAENSAADALYQSPTALDGDIVLIGIDAASLAELGPYDTWGRGVMAECIETLNADPDARPAAIGVDVLYSGESDPEADARLTEAAGQYGNVVVACAANFDSALVTGEDGGFSMDTSHISSVDMPYDALRAVTRQGHINSMYDADGVLRHGILSLSYEGQTIPSFSLALYGLCAQAWGLKPEPDVPVSDGGYWYIDYSAEPGGYSDGYGVADLLDGRIDPSVYAGKAVLIGAYASGLADWFTTSIDHSTLMYGVEYQANCLDALKKGNFKTEAGKIPQLAATFLLLFACAFACRSRRLWACTAAWVVCAGGWVGGCALCYHAFDLVLLPLSEPLAATALFLEAVAEHSVRATREKHAVRRMFACYVAPEVIAELERSPEAARTGGRLEEIAVLFVDIRGFTAMSETLTPHEVVEILNRYLTLTTDCVLKNHGTLDKFIGDCTMAIWNAPLKQTDYVENACRAALDMVAGAQALSAELERRFGCAVGFGVGVHCGPAVVGNIGSGLRMDYTAIGDTVNTASRLESAAPAGQIYISRAVADALGARCDCTPLERPVSLKGKSGGFEILTLNGIKESIQTIEPIQK